jgi:hypothetical protein
VIWCHGGDLKGGDVFGAIVPLDDDEGGDENVVDALGFDVRLDCERASRL